MIRQIGQFIRNLFITATPVPTLTCIKCGKQFRYTGVSDFDETICPECRCKYKGGAYDGMTVGDLYDSRRSEEESS